MSYYADNAKELLKPHFVKTTDQMSGNAVGIYQPLGIIYMIEPWNVPFFQMTRPAAQLMAGNVVVLKHASNCPQCALTMEKLFKDAGLPDGCLTNLFIDYKQSDDLIADPRICGITLTGSTTVGRGVAAKLGHNLKKCVMELGGSDAMVVMPDADIQKSVQGAIDQMIVGNPLNPETTLAPVCSKKAADKVRAQIEKAVANEAKMLDKITMGYKRCKFSMIKEQKLFFCWCEVNTTTITY
ncbi:succinate-semialdehyde dehydrogenase/glutarate-semialdehyde dehydrogenase [Clostridium saccharoperbutylacetonicum]|nr:succinate-semialdehyde dehydrogenase/glutarate-semialdehyde dehydrogenase [Clostridium saccharoperbutylacetonicum]